MGVLNLPNSNSNAGESCVDESAKSQERAARCALAAETSKEIELAIFENRKWLQRENEELAYNIRQTHELLEIKERLELMIKSLEASLRITQENLYTRQPRNSGTGTEGEGIEARLDSEIQLFKEWLTLLKNITEELNNQLKSLRDTRRDVEADIATKEESQNTEECLQLLCALSLEIGDIDLPDVKPTKTRSLSWISVTKEIIANSVKERESAQLLRLDVEQKMMNCANLCFHSWYETNVHLTNRIKDLILAQELLVSEYNRTVFDSEMLYPRILEMRAAIDAKTPAIKIAQARIEKRKKNIGLELCHDSVALTLFRELHMIKMDINKLSFQLAEMEGKMDGMMKNKNMLEKRLRLNDMDIFTNRDKCLHLRQSFPMTTFREFRQANSNSNPNQNPNSKENGNNQNNSNSNGQRSSFFSSNEPQEPKIVL